MKIIYICIKEEYPEYSICGVFDDSELAEKFCQKFGCKIDEWILNPFAEELRKGCSPYFVRMTKEGEVLEIDTEISSGFESGENSHNFDINGNMLFYCMAESNERAVSLANERRVNLIASNQWMDQ